jgi:NADH-quinone oxidoreductase subunit E
MSDASVDVGPARKILEAIGSERGRAVNASDLVPLLQRIQAEYGYLPLPIMEWISRETGIPVARMYGVITFYTTFRLEPMGKHHICVCMGTACHVKGAERLVESLERDLGIARGQTTSDGEYTLDTVNCLGACALAPLVVADEEYYGKMDQGKLEKMRKVLASDSDG